MIELVTLQELLGFIIIFQGFFEIKLKNIFVVYDSNKGNILYFSKIIITTSFLTMDSPKTEKKHSL